MKTISKIASILITLLNNNIAIITTILGVLSIPQINKNLNKLKLNHLKTRGYRTTLLKNSAIIILVSPIVIMIFQKVFLEIFEEADKGISGNIALIMINIYLVFLSTILNNTYMTKSVSMKVEKKYRMVELVILIESIISAISVNCKNEFMMEIWTIIFISFFLIYSFIYVFGGIIFGDDKKNSLKTIKILLEYNELYNCYVRTKCNGNNLKYFYMDENYIILESEQEKLIKVIPMNKIKEISFNYNDKNQ
ncbi:hypothetical protein [Tissierella praeacuta]|uniref:hypothetical protein n=1 Tax=Tissierella praeacuta TaxID=43131 RepID=UPI0028AB4154|nr:hypothetical protein [Tissierella praeacuta]